MAIVIAIITTLNVIWAITGKPVCAPIVAFSGFVCGVSWMNVYAMHAI